MEWVETHGKGRNTSVLLREFERGFVRLSVPDRTVLNTSKVLLFIKSVDPLDQEKVGLLLETDEGRTTDWATVKRVCRHPVAISTNDKNGTMGGHRRPARVPGRRRRN